MTGHHEFSGNEQEALQFLADRIEALTETVATLVARSEVDTQVLSALLASHPEPGALRQLWHQVSSVALSDMYLKRMGDPASDMVRNDATNRTRFWNTLIDGCG